MCNIYENAILTCVWCWANIIRVSSKVAISVEASFKVVIVAGKCWIFIDFGDSCLEWSIDVYVFALVNTKNHDGDHTENQSENIQN